MSASLKQRKSGAEETIPSRNKHHLERVQKKPIIRLGSGSGLMINKIPASIKPIMKRANVDSIESVNKPSKYALQTIASTGTPTTSFQWQQTTFSGSAGSTSGNKKQYAGTLANLPSSTIIQAAGTPVQIRRPTIYIKREVEKRTIRSITLEMIEKNPHVHLGIAASRLPLIKNIVCPKTGVSLMDCYLTLKKLRQNEEFSLLAEYFEISEDAVVQVFALCIVKLGRFLRYLIRWPDSKKYYDRHKNLPFAFRPNLSHVQSLIECVDTEIQRPLQIDCSNYKFIFSITPNGIISYVSEAFVGHNDDLAIFNACDFQSAIPKYLSLIAVPGKAVRRKGIAKVLRNSKIINALNTEKDAGQSADESEDDQSPMSKYTASRLAAELASEHSLTVVDSELTSCKVKNFSIPTVAEPEPFCREQICYLINCLRDYKILQPFAIKEPLLYQYLNEIIIVCAALTNLQR